MKLRRDLCDPPAPCAIGPRSGYGRGCRDRRWPVNVSRPGMHAATRPPPAKSPYFFNSLLVGGTLETLRIRRARRVWVAGRFGLREPHPFLLNRHAALFL